jgi:hypothetical protein
MGALPTFPISKASFISNTYTFDPLYAYDTISQSANIAGGLNAVGSVLPRGTVLCGPLQNVAVTQATLLTTVVTGATARFILAQDIDTSGGQVTGVVYSQGRFLDTAMTFTSQGAALDVAQLWDFGIYVLTVQQRSGLLVPMMKLPATGGPLPQALPAKDAKQATDDEVKAIQAAMHAFQPGSFVPPAPPPPRGAQPAWAQAAFGTSKPTPVEQAEENAAEQIDELVAKQTEELNKLRAEQSQQMSDLAQKQDAERQQLAQQAAQSISAAQQQEIAADPKPAKNPVISGTH